jgi:hypothetical protein
MINYLRNFINIDLPLPLCVSPCKGENIDPLLTKEGVGGGYLFELEKTKKDFQIMS